MTDLPKLSLRGVHFFLAAMAFMLPLSTAGLTLFLIPTVIALCFAYDRETFYKTLKHPVSLVCLLILVFSILNSLHSIAPTDEIFNSLKKKARFLLIPLLLPLCETKESKTRIVEYFCYANYLAVFIVMLKQFEVIDFGHALQPFAFWSHQKVVAFKDSIYSSLFAAVCVFSSLLLMKSKDFNPKIHLPLTLLMLYYVFFICPGRTGQIVLLSLLVLYGLSFQFKKRTLVVMAGMCLLVLAALAQPNSSFRYRFTEAYKEAVAFNQENQNAQHMMSESSIGIRLELVLNSLRLIKEKPILGWGTGSFKAAYEQQIPAQLKGIAVVRDNPHNQYILELVEHGILGLSLVLLLFATVIYQCLKNRDAYSFLAIGATLSIAVGSLANSWLKDYPSALFFIIFVAAFVPTRLSAREY